MKKIFLITVLMIFLMTTIVSATLSSFGTIPGEWHFGRRDLSNRGFIRDGAIAHFDETGANTITFASGSSFEPILAKLDDGNTYLILVTGNYLQLRNSNGILVDELLVASSIKNPPSFKKSVISEIADDFVQEHNYIIFLDGDDLVNFVTYNGTFNIIHQVNVSADYRAMVNSQIVCEPKAYVDCYGIGSRNAVTRFTEYYNATNSTDILVTELSNVQTSLGATIIASNNPGRLYPVLADINRNGYNELIFVAGDYGVSNTYYFYIAVFSPQLDSLLPTFNSGNVLSRSTPDTGMYSNLGSISPLVVYNVDGGGDPEILMSLVNRWAFSSSSTQYYRIYAYNSDGTLKWSSGGSGASLSSFVTSIAICDFGKTWYDSCFAYSRSDGTFIRCVDNNNQSFVTFDFNEFTGGTLISNGFVCADVTGNGIDEIVLASGIYEIDINAEVGSGIEELVDFGTHSSEDRVIIGDVNSNSELDIIRSRSGVTSIFTSNWVNKPPYFRQDLLKGGIFGYYSVACVDTAINFYAQRSSSAGSYVSINDQSNKDYSFFNDLIGENERLVLEFGGETSFGSWSDSGVVLVQHVPNTTGINYYTITVQDEANSDNYDDYIGLPVSMTIPVTVIAGTPGVDCNVASELITSPGDQESVAVTPDSSSEFDSDVRSLFGFSDTLMLLGALIIIIIVSVMGSQYGGAMGMIGGGVLSAIMCVVLGWLSAWIFVLIIVSIISVVLLKLVLFNGSSGGSD